MSTVVQKYGAWLGFAVAAILLFAVAPAVLSDFRLSLLGKFICYAIVAVGIGLAWGRGGMLTLGQGVFFGLGAYMMAMHLKIADAEIAGDDVPDFMSIAGIRELPSYWVPFTSPFVTIVGILFVPGLVALVLGLGVFKRRVKGAYFAILSQALAAAFAILLIGQQTTGGSNGLNRFRTFFGFNLNDPANKQMLFFIAAGVLLAVVAITRQLMYSRYGELLVAVRDQEERVRFLGYDPANVKVVAYVTAAFFAGRFVSYTIYGVTAHTIRATSLGEVIRSGLTSPWGIALQVAMLAGIVALTRIDWRKRLGGGDAPEG